MIQRATACLAVGLASLLAGCAAEDRAVVIAGGDCLFGRGGAFQGAATRWQGIADAIRSSTVFLFNLETTIGSGGTPRPVTYVFQSPPAALDPLRAFPAVVAGLANNHSMDYGAAGLQATMDALSAAGIHGAGAGPDAARAFKPAEVRAGRLRVEVLSAGVDNDEAAFAAEHRAGIAPLDLSALRKQIAAVRGPESVVIVMLHWGVEYNTAYAPTERALAHALVEAGADLVVGSGPHVLRGLERYKGSLICYSLGNLLFDDLASSETSAGMLVKMTVTRSWLGMRKRFFLAPLRTTSVSEGPRAPSPQEARTIMDAVAERSADPRSIAPITERDHGLQWFEVRG